MTGQQLKNSILTSAFLGKLSQQLPTDSPINQLVDNCERDKEKAIKERKYRKEKFRGPISCKAITIPENWCIMYISDMALFQEGPGILAEDFRDYGTPLIRIAGMQTNKVTLDGCNYLDPLKVEAKWKHFKLDVGDILISTSASMDKVCEVYEDCAGAIPYTGQIRFKMYGGISKEYFKWFVQSPLYKRQIDSQKAGAAIKHYGPTHLKKMIIPIAPLEEQQRIVAKIEELLPYVEHYEQTENKLEKLNTTFPDQLKKSILQEAIQGKLVPQDPADEPASILLERIRAEKDQLIKDGKIKREKNPSHIFRSEDGHFYERVGNNEPVCIDEELPFEIPESWEWARFDAIATFLNGDRGKNYPHKDEYTTDGIAWINTGHIQKNGSLDISSMNYISPEKFNSLRSGKIQRGDLLYCLRGATFGKTAKIEPFKEGAIASSLMIIRFFDLSLKDYIFYYLRSDFAYQQLHLYNNGSAQPNLAAKDVKKYLIPLPPLAEQQRIVAKLEQLLPLCEHLK